MTKPLCAIAAIIILASLGFAFGKHAHARLADPPQGTPAPAVETAPTEPLLMSPIMARIGVLDAEHQQGGLDATRRLAARIDTALQLTPSDPRPFEIVGALQSHVRLLPFLPGTRLAYVVGERAADGRWNGEHVQCYALVTDTETTILAMGSFVKHPKARTPIQDRPEVPQDPASLDLSSRLSLDESNVVDYLRFGLMWGGINVVETAADARMALADNLAPTQELPPELISQIHPIKLVFTTRSEKETIFELLVVFEFWDSLSKWNVLVNSKGNATPIEPSYKVVWEPTPKVEPAATPAAPPPAARTSTEPSETDLVLKWLETVSTIKCLTTGEYLRSIGKVRLAIECDRFSGPLRSERPFSDESLQRELTKLVKARGIEVAADDAKGATTMTVRIKRSLFNVGDTTYGAIAVQSSLLASAMHLREEGFIHSIAAVAYGSSSQSFSGDFDEGDLRELLKVSLDDMFNDLPMLVAQRAETWRGSVTDLIKRARADPKLAEQVMKSVTSRTSPMPCAVIDSSSITGVPGPTPPFVWYWNNRIDLFGAGEEEKKRLERRWHERSDFPRSGHPRAAAVRHDFLQYNFRNTSGQIDRECWMSEVTVVEPYAVVSHQGHLVCVPAVVLARQALEYGKPTGLLSPGRERTSVMDKSIYDALKAFR